MRRYGLLGFLSLVLLLGACNQQGGGSGGGNNGGGGGGGGGGDGGGGGGGSGTVTVRLTDPQNAFQKAYYRVGNGSWTQLTFTNGQATFQASGIYEVAVRCGTEVQFYKATRDRVPVLPIVCSQEDTPGTGSVSVTFNVSLPAQIGGVSVQNGDAVLASNSNPSSPGLVMGGQAMVSTTLPPGQQTVGFAVIRVNSVDSNGFPNDITPIGGKLVDLNIQGGQTYSVDAMGWQAFSARNITVTPPPGYSGFPLVNFFKTGMKSSLTVGGINRYGTFPSGTGGKYLGVADYWNASLGRSFFVLKDTGGSDWNVNLPSPWTTGQLSVSGTAFTFTYPSAQAFLLIVEGLLKNATDNTSLTVRINLLSEGSSPTYALPDLGAQLGYQVDPDSERSINVAAVVRGLDTLLNNPNLLGSGSVPTEDQLNGVDVALATASGSYTGNSYTLP